MMATAWSPSLFVLYYELPYLAVAEECDIAVGDSLDFRFHDAAEESVTEGKDFLPRVFAAYLVQKLVGAFLHRFLGLYCVVVDGAFNWGTGEVTKVALAQQRLFDEGALNALECYLCCVETAFEVAAEYNVELKLCNAWAQGVCLLNAKFRKVTGGLSLEQAF